MGASGSVTFVLQRLVSGDDWATLSSSTIEISSGKKAQIRLDATADGSVGETLEHRILLLDSGVKKEKNFNFTSPCEGRSGKGWNGFG